MYYDLKTYLAMITGKELMKASSLSGLSASITGMICNDDGCTLLFNRAVTASEIERIGNRLADKNLIGEDQAFEVDDGEIFVPIHSRYLKNDR